MALNPLAPVTDYQSMLNRIAWFTTASALAAVWMLRRSIPTLDAALGQFDMVVAFGGDKLLPAPAGYLLPALAVGIATRVFRLHGRISDALGIRECFDVDVIVRGLASEAGVNLKGVDAVELREARHRVMRKAFYAFVRGDHPTIDSQLIQQALDAWSWFWVGVEATTVFTLTALGLISCGVYRAGYELEGATLAFSVLALPALRSQCKRYAMAQVREIVCEPARIDMVRAAFAEFRHEEGEAVPAAERRMAA